MPDSPSDDPAALDVPAALKPNADAAPSDHADLYAAVQNALYTLPSKFKTDLSISGVLASDIFTFNTAFAATIESQVVVALNAMREEWDKGSYSAYSFVRQSQQFPDVILKTGVPGVDPPILMGIELKSWYVLAKEKEPSFRFDVTPAVCGPEDLLVIYPWALESVLSGSPRLYDPFIVKARDAAEFRNAYWRDTIRAGDANALTLSTETSCYPVKSDRINDVPLNDTGKNFGRVARTGMLDDYKKRTFSQTLSGIPLDGWVTFFKLYTENVSSEQVTASLERRLRQAMKAKFPDPLAEIERTRLELQALVERLTA